MRLAVAASRSPMKRPSSRSEAATDGGDATDAIAAAARRAMFRSRLARHRRAHGRPPPCAALGGFPSLSGSLSSASDQSESDAVDGASSSSCDDGSSCSYPPAPRLSLDGRSRHPASSLSKRIDAKCDDRNDAVGGEFVTVHSVAVIVPPRRRRASASSLPRTSPRARAINNNEPIFSSRAFVASPSG